MYLPLGSISEGTLKNDDLVVAFSSALGSLVELSDKEETLLAEAEAWLETDSDALSADAENEHEEAGGYLVDELTEALQERCPPFCCFGASEDDGACFGVWFDSDSFEEACRAGEVLKVADLGEAEHAFAEVADASYVAVISDHGNITLYAPKHIEFAEVFSIV